MVRGRLSTGASFSGGPDSVKLVSVMKGLRRRLRLAVIAWLSFQLVSLSALVPLDCCDAHRPADVVRAENCHERADSPYCPMRARNGQACPMHQQAEAAANPHAHHQQTAAEEHPSHHAGQEEQASSEESSKNQCSLGGTCSAPMTALAVILSNHGIVPAEVRVPANPARVLVSPGHDEHLTSRQAAPDSPPPRA